MLSFIHKDRLGPSPGKVNRQTIDVSPGMAHNRPMKASPGKQKTLYRCRSCGREEPKWLGRCPACGEWNTLEEEKASPPNPSSPPSSGRPQKHNRPVPLSRIESGPEDRFNTGFSEINQVLGGGLMRGSSVLLGGEPGIGKSTLMLQAAAALETDGPILYVSGEESPGQIKQRAERLGLPADTIHLLCETRTEAVEGEMNRLNPGLIVVDSVQTLHSDDLGAVPGTVNQIKYGGHELITWAKEHNAALFLIAHVTKGGSIAGPKVIEHMVDTVLYFEQGRQELRILRAAKNRFGSVDEIGLFRMEEKGLTQVVDPARLFLEEREREIPPGIAVAPIYEGSRVLMVEIQALTVPAKSGVSRVSSDRIDTSRVSRIAAVLEKQLDLQFSTQDIYVNVAGGIRLSEVGTELPLAMALYSARTGLAIPADSAIAGEVTLAGEVRTIPHLTRREKTAREMGFRRFMAPKEIRTIKDAVQKIFGGKKTAG